MKDMRYRELVAYANAFVSFVLPKIDVEEIILFGSVARGEATKESDIDLFFNVKNNEKKIKENVKKQLEKFYKSKIYEMWTLRGIKNIIKVEIGNLDKWKLKRSIISEGIILYGRYKALPEKLKGYVYFNIKPIKNITKRNRVIRNLFGRKEKGYVSEGNIKKFNGKRLSSSSFIVPIEKSNDIIKLLHLEKIDFTFFELWGDHIY